MKNCDLEDLTALTILLLVGGLEHDLYFPYIGNFIIPSDELIFFRRVGIPPTSFSKSIAVIAGVGASDWCYPLVITQTAKVETWAAKTHPPSDSTLKLGVMRTFKLTIV